MNKEDNYVIHINNKNTDNLIEKINKIKNIFNQRLNIIESSQIILYEWLIIKNKLHGSQYRINLPINVSEYNDLYENIFKYFLHNSKIPPTYSTFINLYNNQNKIFNMSFHKCMTTSISEYFKLNSFKSIHWVNDSELNINNKIFTEYYVFSDVPFNDMIIELCIMFPNAKYIICIRDDLQWLKSKYLHHIYHYILWDTESHNMHTNRIYGIKNFNPNVMLGVEYICILTFI
jgi:hypothetical protein